MNEGYITERIVNISEIEKLINDSYILAQAMKKESPPEQEENFQLLVGNLKKLSEFEFCVERRKTAAINQYRKEMRKMKRFEELEKLSMPIKDFLEKNYHPHCAVVITTEDVKVVETALRGPLSAEVSAAAKTDIKEIATCDLVEELSRREGVERTNAEPYQQKMIDVNGPAIILTVVD